MSHYSITRTKFIFSWTLQKPNLVREIYRDCNHMLTSPFQKRRLQGKAWERRWEKTGVSVCLCGWVGVKYLYQSNENFDPNHHCNGLKNSACLLHVTLEGNDHFTHSISEQWIWMAFVIFSKLKVGLSTVNIHWRGKWEFRRTKKQTHSFIFPTVQI